MTVSILFGWTFYVVSLSQAGKRTPLNALGDAGRGIGEGRLEVMEGSKGMGLFSAMAGGQSLSKVVRDHELTGRTVHLISRLNRTATALYTITIGLLGLIPPHSSERIRKKRS